MTATTLHIASTRLAEPSLIAHISANLPSSKTDGPFLGGTYNARGFCTAGGEV
jgi:hypothetical protein